MKESRLDFVSSMMPLSNKLRFVGVFLPHVEMHTKESESSSGTCDTSDFLSLFFSFFFLQVEFFRAAPECGEFSQTCLITAIKAEEGRRTLLHRCKNTYFRTLTTGKGVQRV